MSESKLESEEKRTNAEKSETKEANQELEISVCNYDRTVYILFS